MKLYQLIFSVNIFALIHAKSKDSSSGSNIMGDIFSNLDAPFKISPDLHPISIFSSEHTFNPDIHLPFPDLVKKYGYPVEEHEVKTSDGYLLTMFRIPNNGTAVLLVHGMLLSADDFVTIGPQAGLAYQLADAGYDVWLANCRGNKYSLRHVTLPTSSEAYWDFTFDEVGRYDMSAKIDYILKATNAKDLKVIGYSQGTNALLILCSEIPEYNHKISTMILFGLTAFLGHMNYPYPGLKVLIPDFYTLAKSIGLYSLLTDREIGPVIALLKGVLCATPETAYMFCHNLLFLVFGEDHDQVNATSLPVMYGHFPTSISIKTAQHYAQLAQKGKFIQYDYGKDENLVKYQSEDPPEYPLEKVTTNVAIAWGENDGSCSEEDLNITLNKLPNVIDVYTVPHKKFTHPDFVFARDVKTLLYDKLIEIMKSIT